MRNQSNLSDVAALILNYNMAALTMICVDNLLKITEDLTIVIVDNCSMDGSAEKLRLAYSNNDRIHIHKSITNGGYAKGNNEGLKYIRDHLKDTRYVLVLNPDVIVNSERTLIALRRVLEQNDQYAVASCRIVLCNQQKKSIDYAWRFPDKKNLFLSGTLLGKMLKTATNNYYMSIEKKNGIAEVDVVSGCFFMARLEDLERAGDFDVRTFLYGEENILAKKLQRFAKQEAILVDEYVVHNHQEKERALQHYKNRAFDKKCYYDSKKLYIENYSDLHGISLWICRFVNSVDYRIKQIIFCILGVIRRK